MASRPPILSRCTSPSPGLAAALTARKSTTVPATGGLQPSHLRGSRGGGRVAVAAVKCGHVTVTWRSRGGRVAVAGATAEVSPFELGGELVRVVGRM